jgi:predicted phage tail protein
LTATNYTDLEVMSGTNYSYVVFAVNECGESSLSACANATIAAPATPLGLSASASYSQVAVAWNSTGGAASYNLGRARAGAGAYTNLVNLAGTRFADTNVENGATYYYEVSAVNAVGGSIFSAPVDAYLPLPAVSAARAITNIIISWPVTASHFSLFNSTNLSAPAAWTAVTNSAANSNGLFTETLSPSGGEIFYRLISK